MGNTGWSRGHSTAGGKGSIPGWGTKNQEAWSKKIFFYIRKRKRTSSSDGACLLLILFHQWTQAWLGQQSRHPRLCPSLHPLYFPTLIWTCGPGGFSYLEIWVPLSWANLLMSGDMHRSMLRWKNVNKETYTYIMGITLSCAIERLWGCVVCSCRVLPTPSL